MRSTPARAHWDLAGSRHQADTQFLIDQGRHDGCWHSCRHCLSFRAECRPSCCLNQALPQWQPQEQTLYPGRPEPSSGMFPRQGWPGPCCLGSGRRWHLESSLSPVCYFVRTRWSPALPALKSQGKAIVFPCSSSPPSWAVTNWIWGLRLASATTAATPIGAIAECPLSMAPCWIELVQTLNGTVLACRTTPRGSNSTRGPLFWLDGHGHPALGD